MSKKRNNILVKEMGEKKLKRTKVEKSQKV